MDPSRIAEMLSSELSLRSNQVRAALELLSDGATIPFIARYRKERTGSMDEVTLQTVRDRSKTIAELSRRREAIISSLNERKLLTPQLHSSLLSAETLSELEDRYLPFRPKRKTRASTARESGLEPPAIALLSHAALDPGEAVRGLYGPGTSVEDIEAALDGVRDIVAELISEHAAVRGELRDLFRRCAILQSRRARGADPENDAVRTYSDYFEWAEPISRAPSHRVLALLRGAREKALSVHALPHEADALDTIWRIFVIGEGRSGPNRDRRALLEDAVRDAYRRLLAPSLEKELIDLLRETAERVAASVFAANVRDLLMEAPLGRKAVLAVDPGFRTGCKVACLSDHGEFLHYETIFPLEPQRKTSEAKDRIEALLAQYGAAVIAVGNGTGGREAESFLREITAGAIPVIMVDESGASVYSASPAAREEFPDLDVTVRGAISIGRRLMDPLAELVKIDPASIGVGQYQHDVDETLMRQSLDDTVRTCVAAVGVDPNLSGPALLQYVPGLSPAAAKKITDFRRKKGPFRSRAALSAVPGIGPRTMEQAAGFLRVYESENPLDASAVHPERYDLVSRIATDLNRPVEDLIGNSDVRSLIDRDRYVSGEVGIPTMEDIIRELAQPGRDPRPAFDVFAFSETVHTIEDLKPGLVLSGRVTNVTNFGAFVDIGVHRDGLIHISRLSDSFVKDPHEVVRVHQVVTVSVVDVDQKRKRINLALE